MLLSAMFTSIFDFCVSNHVNRKKNFDWKKDNHKPIRDVFRKVFLLIVSADQSEYFGSKI